MKLLGAMQSCDTAFLSRRHRGTGTEKGGRELLSDLLPLSEPSVCCWPNILCRLVLALTNIYISHIQPYREVTHPRWVMLARRWEARADWSRAELWDWCLPFLHWREGNGGGAHTIGWIIEWGLWIGCVIRVFLIYTRPANGICLSPAAWYHSKQH